MQRALQPTDSGKPIGLFVLPVPLGTHVLTTASQPVIAAFTHGKRAGEVVGAVFVASFPTYLKKPKYLGGK